MDNKDVIGMMCMYEGSKWKIVSMTKNALGTYYGIKRHGSLQVVRSVLVHVLHGRKAVRES